MQTEPTTAPEPTPQWTSAQGWERWHDWNARCMQPLSEWFCAATELTPGMRVLDVACGTGLPALSLAARVAPSGQVVATDLSPDMLAAAGRKARAAHIANLELRELNAQALDFADQSFDAVTSAFGLMFCPDPVQALAEMRRVLKPGGRFAIAVRDEAHKSPFFTTLFGAVAQFAPPPPPDPKARGMFGLSPARELDAVLRGAGLSDFGLESRPMTYELDSLAQHWAMATDMAAPVRAAAGALPEAQLARMKDAIAAALAPFMTAAGSIRLPATALCASGRR